jgi:hypothetical protein
MVDNSEIVKQTLFSDDSAIAENKLRKDYYNQQKYASLHCLFTDATYLLLIITTNKRFLRWQADDIKDTS